ncbi:MAG: PmeII family type II restriction endonuclease [Gammaproteobacteria bacterium]|nr:PmeII family type II restriction endonuclease [Gammaproteobacteria bacterium]
MNPEWWRQAVIQLDEQVGGFTDKIRVKLKELKPQELIIRKNPYLFCLRATNDTRRYAESILDAFLSSSEETMFGTLAEDCAVIICNHGKHGWKSGAEGIDIEYSDVEYLKSKTRTIVQVKSGKNWGNSSQRKKMEDYFKKYAKILRQGGDINVRCIEGVCYGPASKNDRGNFHTYIGSEFWKEISGWDGIYLALLGVFRSHAQNGLSEVKADAKECITNFLVKNAISVNGQINWDNLILYVNGK